MDQVCRAAGGGNPPRPPGPTSGTPTPHGLFRNPRPSWPAPTSIPSPPASCRVRPPAPGRAWASCPGAGRRPRWACPAPTRRGLLLYRGPSIAEGGGGGVAATGARSGRPIFVRGGGGSTRGGGGGRRAIVSAGAVPPPAGPPDGCCVRVRGPPARPRSEAGEPHVSGPAWFAWPRRAPQDCSLCSGGAWALFTST